MYHQQVNDLLARVDAFRAEAKRRNGSRIGDRQISILAGAEGTLERLRKRRGGTTLMKVCLLRAWLDKTDPGDIPGYADLLEQIEATRRRASEKRRAAAPAVREAAE